MTNARRHYRRRLDHTPAAEQSHGRYDLPPPSARGAPTAAIQIDSEKKDTASE
jgi:hypothetical protein